MKIHFKSRNPSIEYVSTLFACMVIWCLFTVNAQYTFLIVMGYAGSAWTAYLLMSNLMTYLAQPSAHGKASSHPTPDSTAKAAEINA